MVVSIAAFLAFTEHNFTDYWSRKKLIVMDYGNAKCAVRAV